MELPGGCFVLHTVKDAPKNELPFQDLVLQPLRPWQFQGQQVPDEFPPSQDVVRNDLVSIAPAPEKISKLCPTVVPMVINYGRDRVP